MNVKSLMREEVPKNVVGAIADYLAKHCGIPGCVAQFHKDDAENIVRIIVDFNKNKGEKGNS